MERSHFAFSGAACEMDHILPCTPYSNALPAVKPAPPLAPPPALQYPDKLEVSLAEALAEYRRRAEEILEAHREHLEYLEASWQLENVTIKAENNMLRQELHAGDVEQVSQLWQNVEFINGDPTERDANKKGSKSSQQRSANPGILQQRSSGRRDVPPQQKAKECVGSIKKGTAAPSNGGSWQQFVAWVPSGSALQTPQPWVPLENIHVAATREEVNKDETESSSTKDHLYQVLDVWVVTEEETSRKALRKRDGAGKRSGRDDVSDVSEDNAEEALFLVDKHDRGMLHPHSSARIAWDVTSLLSVIYDMMLIPMAVFDLPESNFLTFMKWFTRVFWTVDMVMSCLTGVVMPNGTVRMEIKFSVKKYIKTWFIMDFFIVGNDWGQFMLESLGDAGFVGRSSRVFRGFRIGRLLRLARMQEVMRSISMRVQSDRIQLVLSILKMVTLVLTSSHVVACCWFGVSNSASETSWVKQSGYYNSGWDAQYLVSLHWALCQFTGGMDEVTPEDTTERVFAVFMWVFCFIMATIVLARITSEMTQLHIVSGNVMRQLSMLRKYLRQNQISSNLTLRMTVSAQHVLGGDLAPELIDLLPVVPEPLRVEMHFEMYSDLFRKHPFFAEFIDTMPLIMRRVGHLATSMSLISEGDVVFSEGEMPSQPKMYFVSKGTLQYCPDSEADETIDISEGQWLCEGCLWTTWTCQGTLTATSDVKLALVDAKQFQDIVSRFSKQFQDSQSGFDPKKYAAKFVAFLNATEDVTDVSAMRYPLAT